MDIDNPTTRDNNSPDAASGSERVGAGERGVLDMNRRSDRRLLAEAIRRGWQIDSDRKARYFRQLDEVVDSADPSSPEGAAAIIGANRILQLEQASALRYLHRRETRQRLNSGKPTSNVQLVKAPVDHDQFRRRMLGEAT